MSQRLIEYLRFTSFVISFFLLTSMNVLAFVAPGNPMGYVNDFAGVLTTEQRAELESKLVAFNASTTNEIAVVTVKSLDGDYIEHYAVELYKAWGIGTKKHDNGVLLLVAVEDHVMRIEVGYGLEGALTDMVASSIIRNDLTPAFKQGDFYRGIDNAVTSIINVTEGEYSGAAVSTKNGTRITSSMVEGFFIFFVVIVQFLSSIFARSKSWWAGGIVGGIIGAILTTIGFLGMSFVVGAILTIILVLLGLLFDYIVSSSYSSAIARGGSIPWWTGGRGGGSGGISFGGFGGGRSGGGGASGGW